jgi:hypothetical protein
MLHRSIIPVRQVSEDMDDNACTNSQSSRLSTSPADCHTSVSANFITSWRTLVLEVDSWLRDLGFFGSYANGQLTSGRQKTRIVFGYNFPSWLCAKTFYLDIRYVTKIARNLDLQILPGRIRVQNRVSSDSPLMMACRRGDVPLIEQCIREGSGNVNDRTICTGSTPLLVSIYLD